MPELPEVETIRLGLLPHVVGRRIDQAHPFEPAVQDARLEAFEVHDNIG